EIMRLYLKCHMGYREIARSCCISHSTVSEYLNRVKAAGLTYEEIEKMDEGELKRLEKGEGTEEDRDSRPQPDWEWVYGELKKKGVTLQLLWQEYKETHPGGYQLSQFYEYYSRWKKKLNL